MRRSRLAVGLYAAVAALALVLAWPSFRLNISNVMAARYLLAGEEAPVSMLTVIDTLAGGSQPAPNRLTTAALLCIAVCGAEGEAQAEVWLRQAVAEASSDQQRMIGGRLAWQGARWASASVSGTQQERLGGARTRTAPGLAAFRLVRGLGLPFPQPYVAIGEFAHSQDRTSGVPYPRDFELAVRTTADTPQDQAYKSMAHARLCEHALHDGNYPLAEAHCREAIRLDSDETGLTTWHRPMAHRLLGEALARRDQ
jgi:hypothetical protein